MSFNENTRVKIPAILHLCRLGYEYMSLSKAQAYGRWNTDSVSRIPNADGVTQLAAADVDEWAGESKRMKEEG